MRNPVVEPGKRLMVFTQFRARLVVAFGGDRHILLFSGPEETCSRYRLRPEVDLMVRGARDTRLRSMWSNASESSSCLLDGGGNGGC